MEISPFCKQPTPVNVQRQVLGRAKVTVSKLFWFMYIPTCDYRLIMQIASLRLRCILRNAT